MGDELDAHVVAEALADDASKLDITRMTREEFLALPFRDDWKNEAGPFTSIVILPLDDIHESGWRKMDFIGCRGRFPVCRLSGQSDNLSLLGVGGHLEIDCLQTSGLLHLWDNTGTLSADRLLNATEAHSTFDLYVNPKDPDRRD